MLHPIQGGAVPKGVPSQHPEGVLRDVPSQGKYVPGLSHPRTRFFQECHIPYWDVRMGTLEMVMHHRATPFTGWICLSGLILSGLIVPGAGMPGPPLCGSTGTIPVPATDRILSLAGSGSELEENGKSGSKKLDTMTLIKEGELLSGVKPSISGLGLLSAVLLAAPGLCQLTELSPQTWTSSGTAPHTMSSTWWSATTAARW